MEINIKRDKTIARSRGFSLRINLGGDEAIFLKDRHATAQASALGEKQSLAMVISRALALPLVGLIFVYQKTLSPDHGFVRVLYPYGYCKFYPSCSEYARLSFLKTGILAFPKVVHRILKCRPKTAQQVNQP